MPGGERKIPTLGSTVPVGNSASLVSHWNGWTLGLGFSYLHWTPMMDSIYLTLLAWLLIQDKKSTRLNSIVSSPKQLLPAILFNKTRLHWCEFIGYFLIHTRFQRKTNQNCISFQFDNDLFTFDVISAINTTSSD